MIKLYSKERVLRVMVSGEPLEFLIDPYGAAVPIRKGSGVGIYDIPESAYNMAKELLPANHTLRCTGYKKRANYRVITIAVLAVLNAPVVCYAPVPVSVVTVFFSAAFLSVEGLVRSFEKDAKKCISDISFQYCPGTPRPEPKEANTPKCETGNALLEETLRRKAEKEARDRRIKEQIERDGHDTIFDIDFPNA